MKIHLVILALLALSCVAHGGDKAKSDFKIHYNSSGLTVVTLESNKLDCTWHTFRKDVNETRANLQSFDKHTSSMSLTESEVDELLLWANNAIQTKVTDDQKKSRRGYFTVLSVSIDGKKHSPDHDTIKAFKQIVSAVIKSRRKEEF